MNVCKRMDRRGQNWIFYWRFWNSLWISSKSLNTSTHCVCQLLPNATSLYNDRQHAVDRGDIILDLIVAIPFPVPTPPFDKHCTVRADWQTMRKSDIRYPRATTDPGPAEGHIATENIKCQVCGNMQREGMWPTWHYHTSGCHCPKRNFTSIRKADRPDWQQCYCYFPWQLAEPTGSLEWGGRLCDGSQSEASAFASRRTYHHHLHKSKYFY